jgi:hypothetical protein
MTGGKCRKEYLKKTYWVSAQFPGFDYDTRTSPEDLYIVRVFVWFPHHLMKKGEKLKCECHDFLEVKGFTKRPRARRVVDFTV